MLFLNFEIYMHTPFNFEELSLMKVQAKTFNEYVFARVYL